MIELNPILEKLFPQDREIVFLHAHADDESFLSAGLLNELLRRKRKCTVVFCAAALVENEERTVIRQREAADAGRLLGVTQILYLEFCEPKYLTPGAQPLVNQSLEKIGESLLKILKSSGIKTPFTLISYDQNGGYGNKDHKIVHALGENFYKNNKDLVQNLFELTINRDSLVNWLQDAKKRLPSQSLPKLSYWSDTFGLPENEITHFYSLPADQIKLKREALAIHASQMPPNEFPLVLNTSDFTKTFGREYLRLKTHIRALPGSHTLERYPLS